MVRDQALYEQAVQLRERGFTLEEIAKVCGVSKSTVSKWLKNNAISAQVTQQNKRRAGQENAKRLRLMGKARQSERRTRQIELERTAKTEYKHYKAAPLFTAGLMLYVAHGELVDTTRIRFSTKQQASHRIFIRFAREYLGVSRRDVRCWLQLYDNQPIRTCEHQWQRSTGLPPEQFYQTQVLKHAAKSRPLHCGVGNTIIGRTVLQQKLLVWVQLAQKELAK